jgi:hypothetical protein
VGWRSGEAHQISGPKGFDVNIVVVAVSAPHKGKMFAVRRDRRVELLPQKTGEGSNCGQLCATSRAAYSNEN